MWWDNKKESPVIKQHIDPFALELVLAQAIGNYAELLDVNCRDEYILTVAREQIIRLRELISGGVQ